MLHHPSKRTMVYFGRIKRGWLIARHSVLWIRIQLDNFFDIKFSPLTLVSRTLAPPCFKSINFQNIQSKKSWLNWVNFQLQIAVYTPDLIQLTSPIVDHGGDELFTVSNEKATKGHGNDKMWTITTLTQAVFSHVFDSSSSIHFVFDITSCSKHTYILKMASSGSLYWMK